MPSPSTAGQKRQEQAASKPPLLIVDDIHLRFGGLNALSGVSFEVQEGHIQAIIGPNGAGKTCILNCICRFYHPHRGSIVFNGRDISKIATHKVAALGIARSFQNIELFRGMTVLDNIKLGHHVHMHSGFLSGGVYLGKAKKEEMKVRAEIEERIIDLLEIEAIRKQVVGTLPYGLQKRVELARALAMRPKILLLDEPMAGMNLEETEDMARFILDVNEEWGVTVVLIEHDMGVVMDISDNVVVLDFGTKIAQGTPEEVSKNSHVIEAYLGADDAAHSKLGL
ncbi:MAG: ABC transporter ATP-binding protein [Desulfarculaceae bacterium]|nr:ABC transporter ATP-binding protein [Desulfarculaceae bacterium]MCF8072277.1 ABC transporter ATP-binding protein [Desulfarculaceae bacterium]MCF8100198.1 ABC transporter ATP-binding protein [Desulfarculaceae bacterium]MCF8116229.1 ABC transporter ATP-binding protein [Desulfarculaceae bacterium]